MRLDKMPKSKNVEEQSDKDHLLSAYWWHEMQARSKNKLPKWMKIGPGDPILNDPDLEAKLKAFEKEYKGGLR